MRSHLRLAVWLIVAMVGAAAPLRSQEGNATGPARRFLAPRTQEVAIRAGRLFDARTGTILTNQVVLIRGDRIAEVGASVQIPREARVIDLTAATVLPGMIDTHVHVNTGGQTPAERALIEQGNATAETTEPTLPEKARWRMIVASPAVWALMFARRARVRKRSRRPGIGVPIFWSPTWASWGWTGTRYSKRFARRMHPV